MGSTIRNKIVLALLSVCILGLLPASAQMLVHQYDLTSGVATGLNDLVGSNNLVSNGGSFVAGGYRFGPGNEGLRLVGPNIGSFPLADEYAIELTFSVDDAANPLNDFHKIVDFDTGFNDAGFYVSTGGTASFVELFPTVSSGPGGVFQDGVSATALVTRAASGEVKVFVDGVEQFSFTDTLPVAVLGFGNTLTFFEDDIFTSLETGLGIVSEIKIYDGPIVPSPTGTPPVTSNVVPNPNPASVNELIVVTATITDTGVDASDITAAEFEVRDMETSAVVLSGLGNDASCPDPYEPCAVNAPFDDETEDVEFTIPAGALSSGVYDVCVRGTDTDPSTGDLACAFLAVYDPADGFVSGGGWIQSDSGFCSLNPLCAAADGKAHFGFVSKYKKGANVPTGQTRFDFKAGDFEFKATEYDWLVVGGPQGKFKGSGTINGSGDYGFMLTAKDSAVNGGPVDDEFRIKIWDNATETIVYDNVSGQSLGGGNIVIH